MKTIKSISILLSVIMLFTMCFGLCGCGEKEPFSEEEELSSLIQTETVSSKIQPVILRTTIQHLPWKAPICAQTVKNSPLQTRSRFTAITANA